MKTTFPELFEQAKQHDGYQLAGAILAFTESLVREMERQGMSRTELAQRLGATPAYVTKILRGKVNFTLATMVRLSRALGTELNVQLFPGEHQTEQREL
jgi:transcriptional regulator with XRE-family HTH domain